MEWVCGAKCELQPSTDSVDAGAGAKSMIRWAGKTGNSSFIHPLSPPLFFSFMSNFYIQPYGYVLLPAARHSASYLTFRPPLSLKLIPTLLKPPLKSVSTVMLKTILALLIPPLPSACWLSWKPRGDPTAEDLLILSISSSNTSPRSNQACRQKQQKADEENIGVPEWVWSW